MSSENTPQTLQLTEEDLRVEKRNIPAGKVRVKTVVESFDEVVREALQTERVEIRHVHVGKEVQSIPTVRTEGDTTIIPVVEEVLVVEKRLLLKEEIHVRRKSSEESVEVPVTLRKQRAIVERE